MADNVVEPTARPPPPRTFYQHTHSFAARVRRAAELRALSADSVPVICEPDINLLCQYEPCQSQAPASASSATHLGAENTAPRPSRSGITTTETPRTSSMNAACGPLSRTADADASRGGVIDGVMAPRTPAHHQLVLPFVLRRRTLVGELILLLRGRLVLDPSKAIFLMVGDAGRVMPVTSRSIGDVYDAHKDADGYLYVLYAIENTYG